MARFKSKVLKVSAAMALVAAAVFAMAGQVKAADAITVGMGSSTLSDASAAMKAAADSAIAALGTKTAKVVIAMVTSGKETAFSVLAAKFGDSAKIYGIPGKDLFNQIGRDRTAIVIAFSGQINAAHSLVARGNYTTAGNQVGTALKAVQTKTTDSKLIILVGDQNNPNDNDVVKGFLSNYGDNSAWVIGGSCGNVFADGKVSGTSILGIMLYGEFDCRFGFEQGTDIGASQTSLTSAKDATKTPTLSIIFDCVGRYEQLGTNGLTTEYNQCKQLIGTNVPFYGGYMLGEIGKKNLNSTAFGSGGSFSVANLYSRISTTATFGNSRPAAPRQILSLTNSKSTTQYRINGTIAKSGSTQPAGVIVSKEGLINVKVGNEVILNK